MNGKGRQERSRPFLYWEKMYERATSIGRKRL